MGEIPLLFPGLSHSTSEHKQPDISGCYEKKEKRGEFEADE